MNTDKYDRQIRLWGEGQYLINTSAILILGVDCTSLEIAKNLVLSGIGQITLLDNRKVTAKDIKENFFLSSNDIYKSIADCALNSILELNPDTKGYMINNISVNDYVKKMYHIYIDKLNYSTTKGINTTNNETLLKDNNNLKLENSTLIDIYDLIVSSNNDNNTNTMLSKLCKLKIKKLVLTSNFGLINYLRIYVEYHAGFQLKLNDVPIKDLRIPCMWKELINFCKTFDLNKQTETEHANVPFIVILYHAISKYKERFSTELLPKTAKEKQEFKNIIKQMSWNFFEETNYNEAYNFFYFAGESYKETLTTNYKDIFKIVEDQNNLFGNVFNDCNLMMKAFFIVSRAMYDFYLEYNCMPLVGTLPDMTSETKYFIELKKIYEDKSNKDQEILKSKISKVLLNYEDYLHLNNINTIKNEHNEINQIIYNNNFNVFKLLTKNWPQVTLKKYTLFETNITEKSNNIDCSESKDLDNFIFYILIKSSEIYYLKHNKYPGSYSKDCINKDIVKEDYINYNFLNDKEDFIKCINEYLTRNMENKNISDINCYIKTIKDIPEEHINEFLRNSNTKPITSASIIGSIASQEIIKLITYSFDTSLSTVIFNSADVTLSTFDI